jgi:hypothetical protein
MTAMQEGRDFQMGAVLTIEKNGKKEEVELLRKVTGGKSELTAYSSEEFDLRMELTKLVAGNIEIALSKISEEGDNQISHPQEILYVSASIKPFINLVWIGIAVMVFGFLISVIRRLPESMTKSS